MNRKTLLLTTLLGLSAASATAADVTYELTFERIAGDSGTATALMTIDDPLLMGSSDLVGRLPLFQDIK